MTAYTSSLSESLTNYDSLLTVMPHWLASTAETLTTSDTMGHQFTAVRPLIDATGTSTLGIVHLPLLFTYLPPGFGTDLGARQVQQLRRAVETITVSDTLNDTQSVHFVLAEALQANEGITLQQTLHRRISDNIPFAGDAATKMLRASRRMVDQVGNDELVSPMLAFPSPRNDAVGRTSGHARNAAETFALAETVNRLAGFLRFYTETQVTSDTILRYLHLLRPFTEDMPQSENRTRVSQYHRVLTELYPTLDQLRRLIEVTHSLSDTLASLDRITASSNKPRIASETLITHDAITLEHIVHSIMGYIWVNNDGQVVADLPDWGYVLIEDPDMGIALYSAPTYTRLIKPWREK